jgi:predicted HicB family RNase H-like nuclease
MINYKHYTYRVTWSADDQEYVGLCAEFPSLSFLAKEQSAALNGIVNLIQTVIKDMQKNDEHIPEPIAEKLYSGKFQIRTTPEVHRKLAIKASELGVSINRYINSIITTV